ncbi:putative Enoyl reductase (ER) domain-containing protein [Seiridium cardinale]|uniref:Enoyl reductase (ER) domain-containing protein n=1 Tax=Seiridium cardinale TaxID=138064 RepID=A0ABR2Y102_9PEZI
MMWCWAIHANGEPREALKLSQVPVPPSPPSGSNLLIRVTHAAINPADTSLFNAWIPFRGRPGFDFIGSVVGVGPKVPVQIKRLMSGMEVVGALGLNQILWGAGTLAEYVQVPAELVALKPPNLTTEQALGCGIAGQTAVMVMKEAGAVEGLRVLVNGASGGVGTVLLQILKARGARVVGICSQRNEQLIERLGADEDLHAYLADTYASDPLDLIIDCVGDNAMFTKSPAYLQPKGKFIEIVPGRTQGMLPFIMNQLRPVYLGGTPRQYKILGLAPSGRYAHELAQWIEDGQVKEILIDSEYKMKDVVQAYDKLMTRRATGKIVIKIQERLGSGPQLEADTARGVGQVSRTPPSTGS